MTAQRFSVAMCVYGGDDAAYFAAAVESILGQTCPPDEIVLVVDGPVPAALDAKIAAYERMPLFHVIRLETNEGHGKARQVALEHCQNELVALMDADDISVPQRFQWQLSRFEEGIDVLGGNIAEFSNEPQHIVGYRTVSADDADIKTDMKKRCPMNQVTVMFRKSSVLAVGGYLDWYGEEDYYLWLRMAKAGMRFANLSEALVSVRLGGGTYRRRGGWKYFKSEAELQKYMRKQGVIGGFTYFANVTKRFIVQILLPNRLRGWIFQKFARSKANE